MTAADRERRFRGRRETVAALQLACISHHPTAEASDVTAMTSLCLLAVLNLPSSTPARAKRLAPFSSARLAPSPDDPLTHFASPRGEKYRLAAEGLIEQAQDRSGQQRNERPDHSLQKVNPLGLGVDPLRLGVDPLGLRVDPLGLGLDFSFDLSDLGIDPGAQGIDPGALGVDPGTQGIDLGSENSDDILPAQIPDFLNGGMDHAGVRFGTAQSEIDGFGSAFSSHERTPS